MGINININFQINMIKGLFSSSRFQLVVVIAILQALVLFKVIDGAQMEGLTQIIQSILAVVVAIRTSDRLGDKKVEAATISKA